MTTYTTDLRLTKQDLGSNNGTWGTVANNVFQLIEDSIAGLVSINVSAAGDYTLSANNGSTDEARNMILRLGGNPSAAKNVVIPAVSKMYVVECTIGTAVTVVVKTNTGTGVNFLAGQKSIIYCDGLNTFSVVENLTEFGITATAAEVNVLDGITATVAELNILDGVTATTAEVNVLDGITATVAELNVLDGITATVAELNILDGVTASKGELNYLVGVCAAIQTQLNNITSVVNNALSPTSYVYASLTGTTFTITKQRNIASVSRTALGQYIVTFTSNIPSAPLITMETFGGTNMTHGGQSITLSTLSFETFTYNSGTLNDLSSFSLIIWS